MKILAVCVRVPEVGKKGDQVLSYHRLKYLSQNHSIHLICFGSSESDAIALNKLEVLGISVQLIQWSKLVAVLNVLTAAFNPTLPLQCALFQSGAFKRAIIHALDVFKPDAIYAVMIRIIVNLPSNKLPLFVDMVDSMGLNFSRRVALERGIKKRVLRIECQRVSAYEVNVVKQATLSFVVSKFDQNFIALDKVVSLPLGIDVLEFFKNLNGSLDQTIVFTGNMNYKPNVDAVLWFYSQCWGKLKDAVPEIRWIVAGSNPTAEVLALRSDDSITVSGRVPSLVAVINDAKISIAPMQSGSGMQFKILEAMACSVPVVTTSLGLGDIAAKPGQAIIVADTPDSFVRSIVNLMLSPDIRQTIGEAGLHYVNEHHSWDTLNAKFEQYTFRNLYK
jgi:glycosyltransferase involved in cell wall biosynthesis